jgi:tRNA G26 N,N-dimethylase Trm1
MYYVRRTIKKVKINLSYNMVEYRRRNKEKNVLLSHKKLDMDMIHIMPLT